MGFRRRTRRRALIAGAAIAHHEDKKYAEQQQDLSGAGRCTPRTRRSMRRLQLDPADQIEHLAQLHASGVLTDEEFAAAKAKALGS